MELDVRAADRGQLVRGALAGVLAAAAVRSLRKGNRFRGALAGVGALVLGYTVVSESAVVTDGPAATIEPEQSRERGELRCAHCGEPIRIGERRGPNAEDRIVHDACLEA